MNIIKEAEPTRMSETKALATIAALVMDGDDWTYTVEQDGDLWIIAAYDEDNIFVGYL